MRILLTGARSLPALCAVRQLAAAGHDVFLADSIADYPTRHARGARAAFAVPPPRLDEEAFVAALGEIATRARIDVLLPAGEEVLYVTRHRGRLERACRVHASSFALLASLHDKLALGECAALSGVATPQTIAIGRSSQLAELRARFPALVLKPRFGRFGRGTRLLRRGDPLPEAQGGTWLAQEIVSGQEMCLFSVLREGRVLAHVAYRPLYGFTWGPAYYCAPVEDPRTERLTTRLLGGAGFTGCVGLDVIDRAGELVLLDCNPRMTTGLALFAEDGRVGAALLGEARADSVRRGPAMVAPCMLFLALPKLRSHVEIRSFRAAFAEARDILWRKDDSGPFWHQLAAFPHLLGLARKHGISLAAAATHYTEWNGSEAPSPYLPAKTRA